MMTCFDRNCASGSFSTAAARAPALTRDLTQTLADYDPPALSSSVTGRAVFAEVIENGRLAFELAAQHGRRPGRSSRSPPKSKGSRHDSFPIRAAPKI